jgi:predicted enzyme related to lactoylglutathione lyase
MTNPQGSFIWYELMTSDPDGAARFYGAVVGWTIAAHSDPAASGVDYRMIGRADGGNAGGVLATMNARGGSKTLGTIFGAGAGAAAGAAIDSNSDVRCR